MLNKQQCSHLHTIMRDPVLFSKHLLKTPLRAYQQEIARRVVHSIVQQLGLTFVVLMARQAGKNELSAHLQLYIMTRWPGAQLVKCSPTFRPQTVNSMERLERLIGRSPLGRPKRREGYIISILGSSTHFFSGAQDAAVVGATATHLLECDEAQDVAESKWNKDFVPMSASTNCTRLLWGTAWTRNGLLYNTEQHCRRLEAQDHIRRVWRIPWPRVALEIPAYALHVRDRLEQLGARHPLFLTQYALEEIDEEGGMFPAELQAKMQGSHEKQDSPKPNSYYALAVDVASPIVRHDLFSSEPKPTRDSTAITLLEGLPAADRSVTWLVRHRWSMTGAPATQQEHLIRDLAWTWHVRELVIDATGSGAFLANRLSAYLGPLVTPFIFTAQSKSKLGWDLLAACRRGEILDYRQYPDDREQAQFWREINAATYAVSARQSEVMTWGVRSPTIHDDFLISTALCLRLQQPHPALESLIIEAPDVL